MASHPSNDNPWEDETSQTGRNQYSGQGYQNPNSYSTYQDQTQSRDPHTQESHQGQYQPPDHPPPHQQPLSSHPPDQQRYYQGAQDSPWQTEGQSTHNQASTQSPYQSGAYSAHTQAPPAFQSQHHGEEVPPSLPPRRSATDLALPTGQDRSHQIEVMQSYEAAGRKDEHDHNVELLQREFPKIDGSLIAAIYGDSKSLSATREMLGELDTQ